MTVIYRFKIMHFVPVGRGNELFMTDYCIILLMALKRQINDADPTVDSDGDCLGDVSSFVPDLTRVESHVVHSGVVDGQPGHSINIFFNHIGRSVVFPQICRPWVGRGVAVQPHGGTNIDFGVFELDYL